MSNQMPEMFVGSKFYKRAPDWSNVNRTNQVPDRGVKFKLQLYTVNVVG